MTFDKGMDLNFVFIVKILEFMHGTKLNRIDTVGKHAILTKYIKGYLKLKNVYQVFALKDVRLHRQ